MIVGPAGVEAKDENESRLKNCERSLREQAHGNSKQNLGPVASQVKELIEADTKGQLNQLISAVENAVIAVTKSLLPAFAEVSNTLKAVSRGVIFLAREFPELSKAIAYPVAALTTLNLFATTSKFLAASVAGGWHALIWVFDALKIKTIALAVAKGALNATLWAINFAFGSNLTLMSLQKLAIGALTGVQWLYNAALAACPITWVLLELWGLLLLG